MSSGVTIREARANDAAAMSAYVARLVAEKLDTILLNRTFTAEEEEATIARYAASDHHCFLLAMHGALVVGMLDIQSYPHPARRHSGVLGMSVDSDFRGQGVGRALLTRAVAMAKSWPDFCRLELNVVPWNSRAITLYESVGFKHEGAKAKAINLRTGPEDDLLMALVW